MLRTGALLVLLTPCIDYVVTFAHLGHAVAFSSATRNSLVMLPLRLAIPGAMPWIPAVVVAQTMVELIG